MKNVLKVLLCILCLSGCTEQEFSPQLSEPKQEDSSTIVPISESPLSDELKDFCADYFGDISAVKYNKKLEAVVYQGDMVYSLEILRGRYEASLADRDSTAVDFRHRAFDSRYESLSKNIVSDLKVYVPPLSASFLTFSEETTIRNMTIDGMLDWNNASNSRLNVSIVSSPSQADIKVGWVLTTSDIDQDGHQDTWYGYGYQPNTNGTPANVPDQVLMHVYNFHSLIGPPNDILDPDNERFNVKSLAAHELGHAIGLGHNNEVTATYIPGTSSNPVNTIMPSGSVFTNPRASIYDLDAINIMYPGSFPYPILYCNYDFFYHHNTGIKRINIYPVQNNSQPYGKCKIYVRDETTGVSTKIHEGLWINAINYTVPHANRTYRISIQGLNWRHDQGTGFVRKTVYVP